MADKSPATTVYLPGGSLFAPDCGSCAYIRIFATADEFHCKSALGRTSKLCDCLELIRVRHAAERRC